MTKDYIKQMWKFLGIYFAVLILIAIFILCSGCAASFPIGASGKYGSVGVAVSYYPPSEFCGVFPPSYLPDTKGFRK